jgi:hypothetical protein
MNALRRLLACFSVKINWEGQRPVANCDRPLMIFVQQQVQQ